MDSRHRALLFWLGCIPARLTVAYNAQDRPAHRVAAGVVAWWWLSGMSAGTESFFGGFQWWANERAQHGLMWLGFALTGEPMWLVVDAAYGAVNWLVHE